MKNMKQLKERYIQQYTKLEQQHEALCKKTLAWMKARGFDIDESACSDDEIRADIDLEFVWMHFNHELCAVEMRVTIYDDDGVQWRADLEEKLGRKPAEDEEMAGWKAAFDDVAKNILEDGKIVELIARLKRDPMVLSISFSNSENDGHVKKIYDAKGGKADARLAKQFLDEAEVTINEVEPGSKRDVLLGCLARAIFG